MVITRTTGYAEKRWSIPLSVRAADVSIHNEFYTPEILCGGEEERE